MALKIRITFISHTTAVTELMQAIKAKDMQLNKGSWEKRKYAYWYAL